jgi:uncharacterized protein YqeY
MSEGLKQRLVEAMKAAMRAQDKPRLSTIRLALSAVKQREVDERIELSDTQVVEILTKMLKQRKDSIEQYEKAKRQDLADIEQAETLVINEFLPAPLSADEIEALIVKVIAETGAMTIRDMGKVMAELKGQMAGRADLGEVGAKVRAMLNA